MVRHKKAGADIITAQSYSTEDSQLSLLDSRSSSLCHRALDATCVLWPCSNSVASVLAREDSTASVSLHHCSHADALES